MTKEKPRNMAASVRQRLTNLARARNEDFQLVLNRYAFCLVICPALREGQVIYEA